LPRVRLKLRWLMVLVALVALSLWAERMWKRRAFYLEQAAPHAKMEAFYSGLALDLAGVPRQPPSRTVSALTPDGKGIKFLTHGPAPRVYYPLGSNELADEATFKRLIAMCQQEAAKEGAIRRLYERQASHPWLPFDPERLER
jgi:hypothetical protein